MKPGWLHRLSETFNAWRFGALEPASTYSAVSTPSASASASASASNLNGRKVEDPEISQIDGVADPSTFWPRSLAHLAQPYDDGGSDYVVIGEISDSPVADFVGYRKISVALVSPAALDRVVTSTAATCGCHVESHGPLPIVDEGDRHRGGFWINGFEKGERFEPLINAWSASKHEVMLPDPNMLMVYGLVPRYLQDGSTHWDDPHGPVYDVIRARTHADFDLPSSGVSRVLIEIRREYLSDYCSIKGCAAVAFYFEERRSDNDPLFDQALAGRSNEDFHFPGRLLNLQHHRNLRESGRQYAQAWGRRLVLESGERRVLEAEDPSLEWPDYPGPMSLQRASAEWLYGYVRDEVLEQYQGRSEFRVAPESGSVSYRGQWSVGFVQRHGRNHLKIELKKLYEGTRPSVITHWHQFAVRQVIANADQARYGERNIGSRAKDLIYAFLALTETLTALADRLNLSFGQQDVGGYSTAEVTYRGWWSFDNLMSLGNVVPVGTTRDEFLDRSVAIMKLLESLQAAPLRNLVLMVGIDRKAVQDYKAIKLIGALCQLATITRNAGHRWPEDAATIAKEWDPELKLDSLRRVFAVNQLRIRSAHRTGQDFDAAIAKDASAFGIDPSACTAGWGLAVDKLYDELTHDMKALATLLEPSP